MNIFRIVRAIAISALVLLPAVAAQAAEVGVVGLFPGKAVLIINGATPKTYAIGASLPEGIKLLAVSQTDATLEIGGKRQVLAIGQHVSRAASGPASVTLQADGRGHFMAQGQINGGTVNMLVDTGATSIALSGADAARLGINYRQGQMGAVNTAAGITPAYRVKLDTVRVGDIEINQVDAVVIENGLNMALLGMSFLNRMEMRRDGQQMVLTKRY